MSTEEREQLAKFFMLLEKVDRRLDPEWYLLDNATNHD
jgi:hypothetical protein